MRGHLERGVHKQAAFALGVRQGSLDDLSKKRPDRFARRQSSEASLAFAEAAFQKHSSAASSAAPSANSLGRAIYSWFR
jgi:hypothetical protein